MVFFFLVLVSFLFFSSCGRHRIWLEEETMQDAAQFVQLTQTLCYDLASEKATDGKKTWRLFFVTT